MSENGFDLKLLLARIDDLAAGALKDQGPKWTDFLDPAQREQAEANLRWQAGVRFSSNGGYAKAERRRLVIYPDYYFAETIPYGLDLLEISPKTDTEQLTHRDYLGAVLGLGIERDKIGDLLVTKARAQLVVVPEMAEYIMHNLIAVGNTPVTVISIDPEQLQLPEQREKEIRSTVASLRLDAIAALGFGESRTKMAKEIKAEKVKVNWRTTKLTDDDVKPGDIISMRGRGRVEFREITGKSKKGRIGVLLVRFL